MKMNIPLIKPFMTQEIKDSVLEVLDSGYITEGPVTRKFESKLKEVIGWQHLLAVTSATTGLVIALRTLKTGSYSLYIHDAFKDNALVEIARDMKNSKWCYSHTVTLFDDQVNVVLELINCL
jgi:dTDP-4-amino-4,6-dideoxygalactose transaminase